MLPSWYLLGELECVTSWSIKVRCLSMYSYRPDEILHQDTKVVYRRYASLFFVCGISAEDNELITLEIIHRYVEVLDRYFGNVRHRPIYTK